MEDWSILIKLLILLSSALLLGTLAEQFRQSAIVGYLLGGAIVGPHVLGLLESTADVQLIAELGIALLLFTIGLEFSIERLYRLGAVALGGGTLQILLTLIVVAGVAALLGVAPGASVALGCMFALSSTACVLRLLVENATLESPYGRNAMGILLLQDAAVLPLTLIISAMAGGGGLGSILYSLGRTLVFGALMVAAFLVLFNYVVPRLLNIRRWAANRELPILLAIIVAIGSATAAHNVGISPAMGAFLAGVLLAASPFAVQIRADVAPIKTVLVTLFFASVGMLANPKWVLLNWHLVSAVVVALVAGKAVLVWAALRPFRVPSGLALATGLCLAQVGEFSFVLATIARGTLIDEEMMRLVVAVTVLTLLLTPYLVSAAPRLAEWMGARLARRRKPVQPAAATQDSLAPSATAEPPGATGPPPGLILIIGFGPAGQRVAEALLERHQAEMLVIDLNPRTAGIAQRYGLSMRVGDASQAEVLESAGIHHAQAVVVTLPDPAASRQVIYLCRHLNPQATLVVRARYHVFRWELQLAGAEIVVDEEQYVGVRLAAEVRRALARSRE